MKILTWALRNIWRYRHRSGVIISAMAFAGFIMIFYATLMEGLLHTTEKNAIAMETGQFQVHAEGYRDDPDLYKRIADPDELLGAIKQKGFNAAPRLYGFGLAAAGSSSAGVMMRGVNTDLEKEVTEIHKHLLSGSWLSAIDPAGVVIGRRLAKILGVKTGSEVVIVSQAADGSMANELYLVRGILKSVGEGIDRGGFFMLDKAFRQLMVMPEGIHEIAIHHPAEFIDLEAGTVELAGLMPGLEVMNWRQLMPVVARILDVSKFSLLLMLFITYTAVGILTLNSMLMGVFERIHEFGIIKALGVPPWQIFSLITMETVIQTLIASTLALVTAVPLSIYCETHPVDLTSLASTSASIAGVALDPLWYCRVTMDSVVTPVLVLFAVSLVAIIYPAGKAALIRPLQAIYHR
ncbi:MAG: FtsX-like permease family protein [Thermodesulfobacteriota bacterium]